MGKLNKTQIINSDTLNKIPINFSKSIKFERERDEIRKSLELLHMRKALMG